MSNKNHYSDSEQDVYSSNDLTDTIEFTQEEITKLRKPNRRQLDDDYFSKKEEDYDEIYQIEKRLGNKKIRPERPRSNMNLSDMPSEEDIINNAVIPTYEEMIERQKWESQQEMYRMEIPRSSTSKRHHETTQQERHTSEHHHATKESLVEANASSNKEHVLSHLTKRIKSTKNAKDTEDTQYVEAYGVEELDDLSRYNQFPQHNPVSISDKFNQLKETLLSKKSSESEQDIEAAPTQLQERAEVVKNNEANAHNNIVSTSDKTIEGTDLVVDHDNLSNVSNDIITNTGDLEKTINLSEIQNQVISNTTDTVQKSNIITSPITTAKSQGAQSNNFSKKVAEKVLEKKKEHETLQSLDGIQLENIQENLNQQMTNAIESANSDLAETQVQNQAELVNELDLTDTMELESNQETSVSLTDLLNENVETDAADEQLDHQHKMLEKVKRWQDKVSSKFQHSHHEHAELTEQEIEAYSDELSQATARYESPILTDQVIEEYLGEEHIAMQAQIESEQKSTSNRDQSNIVKGATWLTIGSVMSRILGAVYVIPWAAWLGQEYTNANALFSIGYKPYALFLAISTAGFPSAIAKQIAYYHSKKQFKTANQLFNNSMLVMTISGLVSALLLFFLAPYMAAQTTTDNIEAATLVMRTLVPALLIFPPMSLLRGYFQGLNNMRPTAVSQVLEQIVRVVYMLVATFAIMQVFNGHATVAVAHSTFAAFLGGGISLLYLIFLYVRHIPLIKQLTLQSQDDDEINMMQSIKVILRDSIPFIILGAAITIMQNMDMFTFSQIMRQTSVLTQTEVNQLYGAMSLDADKLVMIIISVAVALGTSLIPSITRHYAKGDVLSTGELVSHITVLFFMVMLPAALGMAVVSKQAYGLFYAENGHPEGPALLITSAITSISLGAYTVIGTILQSMSFRRKTVQLLIVGFVVKAILQYPLIMLFNAHGALIATGVAFAVVTILVWREITKVVPVNTQVLVPQLLKVSIATIIMSIIAFFWTNAIDLVVGPVGRVGTFIELIVIIFVAGFIYSSLLGLFGMLNVFLGDRYEGLQDNVRLF